MEPRIRPYSPQDKETLLDLMKTLIPTYFAPAEWDDYHQYLTDHLEAYFVITQRGKLIGAGGINYFYEDQLARLSWDIVHPEAQGQGMGKALLRHRISIVQAAPKINQLIVRTSQFAHTFYQQAGFRLQHTQTDYWAPGFDLYVLSLSV